MRKVVALAILLVVIVSISIVSIILIQYVSGNWYNYTPNTKSPQLENETLNFVKNILQLDYTKYYGKAGNVPDQFNPFTFQYFINYKNGSLSTVEKNRQMLTVTYVSVNHTAVSFTIDTTAGLVSYHGDADNVINQTRDVLERYQTQYNAPYVQEFVNSLDSYSTILNSSQQIGDFRLDIHSGYGLENITWSRTVNSIPNSFDTLTFIFEDGLFNSFSDNWNSFIIASNDVNISQEMAVQIANSKLQTVQNVPFDGGFEGISDVKIVEGTLTSTLSFQPIGKVAYGETGTLNSCWQLTGSMSYNGANGFATAPINAVIRADTGQIQELRLGSYSLPT